MGKENIFGLRSHNTVYQQRKPGQDLDQTGQNDAEAMEGCCSLACSSWLAQPAFLYTQDRPPRGGTVLNGLGSPPSITEKLVTFRLQPDLKEAFSQLRLSALR